ncbi:D-Ala-D-Ala carboxypeptidase family metallohydrolase [Henriciella sp. AS95]|uniref:D-Ala-D-Ala carboxypeptidase family metallohydrolase n=1 Tax=Henriciella sp. AS95 TaxID=3135782 RepID=UPI0031707970
MLKLIVLAAVWKIAAAAGGATEAETPLQINGEALPYSQWHVMAMPGDTISYDGASRLQPFLDDSSVDSDGSLTAPDQPGIYDLEFRTRSGDVVADLALFVLEPSSRIDADGRLNGYRIGQYPENEPKGFIRLDEGYGDVNVSPSFRIGQFLCKQQPDHWPKYLLISSDNLDRLEHLLAALNEDGITDADTFFVMSGYRTPFYNTAIGSAKLSRHMYGDATDVYVDVSPKDGIMDDVNRDGALNKEDANFFFDYADELFSKGDVSAGGLGSYGSNAVHGPFVHVDGRGRKARWGR